MIPITTALVALLIFLQTENSSSLPTNETKCEGELDINKSTISELLKIRKPSGDDAQHEEYMGCLWKSKGLVNEEGILQLDKFRNVMISEFRTQLPDGLAEGRANDAVNYCRDDIGGSPGETAVKIVKCLGRWKVQAFIDNEKLQWGYK